MLGTAGRCARRWLRFNVHQQWTTARWGCSAPQRLPSSLAHGARLHRAVALAHRGFARRPIDLCQDLRVHGRGARVFTRSTVLIGTTRENSRRRLHARVAGPTRSASALAHSGAGWPHRACLARVQPARLVRITPVTSTRAWEIPGEGDRATLRAAARSQISLRAIKSGRARAMIARS